MNNLFFYLALIIMPYFSLYNMPDCPTEPTVLQFEPGDLKHNIKVSELLASTYYTTKMINVSYYDIEDEKKLVKWAANCDKIYGINMSYVWARDGINKEDFVEYIDYGQRIFLVASAGNDGRNIDLTPRYPASLPGIIKVCANDLSYSNISKECVWESGKYGKEPWGTSFAAPRVLKRLVEEKLRGWD